MPFSSAFRPYLALVPLVGCGPSAPPTSAPPAPGPPPSATSAGAQPGPEPNPCAGVAVTDKTPYVDGRQGALSGTLKVRAKARTTWVGGTITIAPGTTFVMEEGASLVFGEFCGGRGARTVVHAEGTAANPIRVCPAKSEGATVDEVEPSWGTFAIRCRGEGSRLRHVKLVGGGAGEEAALTLGPPVVLDEVQVLASGALGLFAASLHPRSRDLTIVGGRGRPAKLHGVAASALPEGRYAPNADPVIALERLEGEQVELRDRGVPYLQLPKRVAMGAPGRHDSLTLHAGVEYRLPQQGWLVTGFRSDKTTLRVLGTEDAPVVLTSYRSPQGQHGDWGGLEVASGTTGNSEIDHLAIVFAGNSMPALTIGAPITVGEVVISRSSTPTHEIVQGVTPRGEVSIRTLMLTKVPSVLDRDKAQYGFFGPPPEPPALPDLIVRQVTPPATAGAGRPIEVRYQAINPHPTLGLPALPVALSLCPGFNLSACIPLGTGQQAALPARTTREETIAGTVPSDAPGGNLGVLVSVRTEATVEAPPENNAAVGEVRIETAANLAVTDVVIVNEDGEVRPGASLTGTVTIANHGYAVATAPEVRVVPCSHALGCLAGAAQTFTAADVAPTASVSVPIDLPIASPPVSAGAYWLEVTVNGSRSIQEFDYRDNDHRQTTFTALPPPDLRIRCIEYAESSSASYVRFTVETANATPVEGPLEVRLFVDGAPFGTPVTTYPRDVAGGGASEVMSRQAGGYKENAPVGSRLEVWVSYPGDDGDLTPADNRRAIFVPANPRSSLGPVSSPNCIPMLP